MRNRKILLSLLVSLRDMVFHVQLMRDGLDHGEAVVSSGVRRHHVAEVRELFERDLGFVTDGMDSLVEMIEKASFRNDPILVLGESGTGKGQVVRAIEVLKKTHGEEGSLHELSCAEIPPTLIESELFGHEKGAYTDAKATRVGRIEQANGGRLFLDEIAELSKPIQAKLLRVIEDKRVCRIGQNVFVPVKVQILAATSAHAHGDPHDRIRTDLYYRLSSNVVEVPPLRDRPPEAKHHLVREAFRRAPSHSTRHHNGLQVAVDDAVIAKLSELQYPGNVRQLMNIVTNVYAEAEYEAACSDDVEAIRVEARHITKEILRTANHSSHPRATNGREAGLPASLHLNDRELWTFLETCKEVLLKEGSVNIRAICRYMRIQPRRFYGQLMKCPEFRNFQPTQPENKRYEFLEHLLKTQAVA